MMTFHTQEQIDGQLPEQSHGWPIQRYRVIGGTYLLIRPPQGGARAAPLKVAPGQLVWLPNFLAEPSTANLELVE